ncbi:thiol reductant ABC exporter subunit CydC [Saliterribacillus persicus]|uniref:ATP-binding cassette subfamily C protein CydC n=1 Tax=Saliterribacillus persicus TaxID=930114 RepID=A0A368Y153_9BACI|nr:thiol reductant ABC exporter subunit CydC [Saliterribacillus persicus]RCW71984.1 ATP-binding cassette subfamily C protein CydC [Saliterribacillus persicus]
MNALSFIKKYLIQEKKDMLLAILFGVIAGIASIGLFAASGYLIAKSAFAPPLYALVVLTSTVKLLGFTKAIAKYLERYTSHRATFSMLQRIRDAFFDRVENMIPKLFYKIRSGDLLTRVVTDVESLQDFFLRVLYPPIVFLFTFLATIFFTSFYSIWIALVLIFGMVISILGLPYLVYQKQKKIKDNVQKNRASLATSLIELFEGFRDIKIFQLIEKRESQLRFYSEEYEKEQERQNNHISMSQSIQTLFGFFIVWIVIGLGSYLVTIGEIDGIYLAMLVILTLILFEDTSSLASLPIYLENNKKAINRLNEITAPETEKNKDQNRISDWNKEELSLKCENVNYRYPNSSHRTLKNISTEIKSGEKIAIIGTSGSGKSTLLQLLLKLLNTDENTIYASNIKFNKINDEAWWEQASVVLQDNHFFYGTIRENLFADDTFTEVELQFVLKQVELHYFNLDELVHERGDNLSGGEKQRLAIARAMLKNGNIWFLDEPTSSIDQLTANRIMQRLFDQNKAATFIYVTHRLLGLENMDKIIVMDKGEIIEQGTPGELISKRGYYFEMKNIEASLIDA